MNIHIITLFPEMFHGPLTQSIIGRAIQNNIINIQFTNPRDFTTDKHRSVDAPPYGGGPGMVMMPQPLAKAVEHINQNYPPDAQPTTILTSPQGTPFNHQLAQNLAQNLQQNNAITIVCGHYEGVDERFIQEFIDIEISIGDFILTGGEIPAIAITDAITRLLPGTLGHPQSTQHESFSNQNNGILEGPVYTRPPTFRGRPVPQVLLNGNQHQIQQHRKTQAAQRTLQRRPDLMQGWPPNPQ